MLQLTTKYDKIGDSRKKVFMIRGDEAYAHTTNITLEQNGNITTGDNRGFKINLRGTIYRNLGSSNVTIYDGEEILSLIPIGDGEHSFSLNNLYLSYVYDHELYAVFDANSQCMGSKSKKIALNVPLPSTLKTSITFDNLPTQVNPNANVNVRMIARMNNDIVADGTEIKVYDNNVLVGTGETSDGVATVTINGMSQGKHTITASIEKSTTINATSSSADISCGYNMEFTTIPNIFMNNTNNTVRITVRDYYDAVVPNKSVSFASKTATTNNQGVATFTITSMTNGSTYTATCSGSTVSRTVNAFTVSSLNLSVEDGVTATNQDEKISIALTGSGYTGSIPTTITTSTGISNSTYLRNNDVTDWYYQGESAGDVTVSVKCGNLTKTVTIEDIQMGYKANSYQYNLDYSYNELSKEISVNAVDNTEIIKITVTDKNARVASLIANNVAEVFISEVIKIYNMDNVSVIDEAEVNYTPSNNNLIRDAILSMLVSFVAVSGIVFVVYYFDDTLRDVDSIEKEIELPVVAKVFKDKNGIELIVDKKPNAAASESIRTLRTNLQFASVDKAIKTILVTSTLPSEGKSFISANLATSFAQAGKKVLLVDCDLRKGRQHKIFKIAGKNGLSNLLIGDISKFKDYVVETKIANLSVMSRGIVPPNPSELLNSKKNKELIEKLNNEFDIVILDGAPITGLSDSLILSSMVDKVLLVTSINHTPKTELLNTKKSLLGVGADLAGCVANNIVAKNHHYGNYYYNSYYR